MNHLSADATRCHDDGCPQHQGCLRWIERDTNWEQPYHHAVSLFPYDLPLGQPCPLQITADNNQDAVLEQFDEADHPDPEAPAE